ncbi:hypothetical protein SmJEL517_g02720 [Synchytrium microbalum]|uniref:Uncharacterized protein n=1 Tax=Synchytrium microbalum TaxID=1806994 RepID=A0A507BZG4_9FUNG|nr:uncharacterized protein SmJEL517_g02720 [Synchytrium microbalum]TPX34660.1 hypothetical protein SmJEL517_g02720 [Synchytrium microbalum]
MVVPYIPEAPSAKDAGEWGLGLANSAEMPVPVKLHVTGNLPEWLAGQLFRAGPSKFEIPLTKDIQAKTGKKTYSIHHWFDGMSVIHRFDIRTDGSVWYSSRATANGEEAAISESGISGVAFAQRDICRSLFKKVFTTFTALTGIARPASSGKPDSANVGVTVSLNYPLAKSARKSTSTGNEPLTLLVKTDANILQELDPVTLEPVRVFNYTEINPAFPGALSAAHHQFDASTREYYNYTIEFGPKTKFHLFTISEANPKGRLLVTINNCIPAYVHSFTLTDKYIVIPFYPYSVSIGGVSVLWHQNVLDSLVWDGSKETRLAVVDRKSGAHVATYVTDSFFAFHTINAWDAGDDIIFDTCGVDDATLVTDFYLNNMRKKGGLTKFPRVRRYVLSNLSQAIKTHDPNDATLTPSAASKAPKASFTIISTVGVELPRFNPHYHRKPYQYVYGISTKSDFIDALCKVDVTGVDAAKVWSEPHCYPGEPVFMPSPNATAEDDGVILSVVLDASKGSSFLLVLDAHTFVEVARAGFEKDHVIPFGFHGAFNSVGK